MLILIGLRGLVLLLLILLKDKYIDSTLVMILILSLVAWSIFDFIKYGRPTDEALDTENQEHRVDGYKIDGHIIENLTGTSEKKGKTVI